MQKYALMLVGWLTLLRYGTEPVCTCGGGGLPQCYTCNSTSQQDCERLQVLETCPTHEVCINI